MRKFSKSSVKIHNNIFFGKIPRLKVTTNPLALFCCIKERIDDVGVVTVDLLSFN